jgi:alcohol dehydrogenase
MKFYMPVTVYEEASCVWNHRKELAALGRKALIVTGKNSAKNNGSLRDVQKALAAEDVDYVLFDEVEENPSVETVMRARALGLTEGVDFVVGIGGGSPLDAAKAAAVMLFYKEEEAAFLYEQPEKTGSLPMAAVPTTCGTGSEVTAVSVLTRHDKRTKGSIAHRVFPKLALLDVKYLANAPHNLICDTAVDALGHLIESYLNNNATDYSRMLVREGLVIWSLSKDVLLMERQMEEEDLHHLLMASLLGGMAIAHTGTSIPHALSYALTYELGMPHGKAVGYFLPGYVDGASEPEKNALLALMGFADVQEFAAFYRQVCAPQEVPGEVLERSVSDTASNLSKLALCPYPLDREALMRMGKC